MAGFEEPELAKIARLIGEPTRVAMLSALLSGKFRWLVRLEGTRAVRLTQRGREGLR